MKLIYILLFSLLFYSAAVLTARERTTSAVSKTNKQATEFVSEPVDYNDIRTLITNGFSYTTLKAQFRERAAGKLRHGTLWFSKPAKIRIEYRDRNKNLDMLIVTVTNTAYIYFPDLKIVCEQQLLESDSDAQKPGVGKLSSMVNLDKLFEIYNFNFIESMKPVPILSEAEENRFRFRFQKNIAAYHFKLDPKDITREYGKMHLWVEPAGIIRRVRYTAIDKRIIDMVFFNIEPNYRITADVYDFEQPADTQKLKNVFFSIESATADTLPKE